MDILNLSFSASVLILTAIIIRVICIHKLPRVTFVVIWGIIISRLLLPVTIPSRFSIYNLINTFRDAFQRDQVVQTVETGQRTIGEPMQPFIPDSVLDPAVLEGGGIITQTNTDVIRSGIDAISSSNILLIVWLTGIILCTLFFLITHYRHYIIYRTALPVRNNEYLEYWHRYHPLRRNLRITQSDRIDTPLTYGIIRPVILLPKYISTYDEANLSYILTHEYTHVRRFDTLYKWILAGTLALHWFNPLVWIMYILANRDLELSCDEAVVKAHGDKSKSSYAMALVGLAEKSSGLLTLSSNFSKNAVEERVRSIMKAKKSSYAIMVTVLVIMCCATFIFTTTEAAELPFTDALNETPFAASLSQGSGSSGDSQENMTPANNNSTNTLLTTTLPAAGTEESFSGKIAIVTTNSINDKSAAVELMLRYGAEKIVHKTWPDNLADGSNEMIDTLLEIASDPEIKALVINQAVQNTNTAVSEFRKVRNDVFVIYCTPSEPVDEVAVLADLILCQNDIISGETIVMQAKSMGAGEFVFYTFPRHLENRAILLQRDMMRATAEREGLGFIEVNTPDPMIDSTIEELEAFINADMKEHVERFGVNTAFYGTGCGMQVAMIQSAVETGAIYPRPCCPSPYHAFPRALNIADMITTGLYDESGEEIMMYRNLDDVIADTRAALRAGGVEGRISNWAISASMLLTNVGVEYAITLINGQTSRQSEAFDLEVINALAGDFAYRVSGEPTGVSFNFMELDGTVINNYIVGIIDSFIY